MAKTQSDYIKDGAELFAKGKPCPALRPTWQAQAARKGWNDASNAAELQRAPTVLRSKSGADIATSTQVDPLRRSLLKLAQATACADFVRTRQRERNNRSVYRS